MMMALQQQALESISTGKETMLSRTASHMGNQSRVQDSGIIGKEEMMDLRKQLQSEAENIARWKASTEVKAKNMERDIQEKQSIIDDQRSNLMELQLHSEHLSQSLFQERQERELVSAKVGHTRQLFLTLQEQYELLSETVSNFQNSKDEIQKDHDCLIEKLIALKQSFELQENFIENMTSKAEEKFHNLENTKELWQRNFMEKDQELKEMNAELENLKSSIENLSDNLESTTINLSAVEKDKAHLCSELDEVKASLVQTQEELKLQKERLTDQITKADEELKLEHEQLMERTKEFQEAVEKIQYLKKVNDTLEGSKSELTERVTALATRKQELEEEISYKANVIETLQSTQNKSIMEINELNGRFSDVCSQLSIVEGQKSTLEQERNTLADKLQSNKKKLLKKKKLLEQFKEQVTALQSDLEIQKEALIHLEEENKNKQEINHNLEVSLNEINKKNVMCNEAMKEMEQKISLTENHEVELTEEKKKIEEDLEKTSSDLKTKILECEDLSATVKMLKDNMKKLEKECEVKIKNVSSETKSRRILEQKINGLEEKLKKAMKSAEDLQDKLEKTKSLLIEKEKESEELKESLDHVLCEKQEIQYRYEAKDQSFQSYQSSTNTSLDTLKIELDQTKEVLKKNKGEYEQQVLQLQEELDKAKEDLNSSKTAHEIQLQETAKTFHEQQNTSMVQCEELASLKAKVETMTNELEQAKQEASTAISEKLQIKLESDNKVKEMGDLLDIYKTDKEAKLKIAEEELQKSNSQIAELIQERDELLAKIKAQIQISDTDETVKAVGTQDMKNNVKETSTVASMSSSLRTPSPDTYLASMNTFAEPSIPPAPRANSTIRKPEAKNVQGKQVPSILKTGRRTLLPPEYQKRVVFKPLTPIKDYASGDSSSDAYTFEVADSDDPFEEIKRARRYPSIRPEKVPRANVAPFIPETNISMKAPLPLSERNMNDDANKGLVVNSSRKKRVRSDPQKQNLKTYSPVSPKNKQQKP